MGISCKKQTGKFRSIIKKMENQLLVEKQVAKTKKEKRGVKK